MFLPYTLEKREALTPNFAGLAIISSELGRWPLFPQASRLPILLADLGSLSAPIERTLQPSPAEGTAPGVGG